MKKLLIVICFLTSQYCFSQSLPDYESVKMEQKSDYIEADKVAAIASNYILTTPFEKNDLNRLKSLKFVIKWMTGSPDFTFTIDEAVTKIAKGNDDLLALYMVAMSNYALENREAAKDEKKMKLNSIKLLLAYCENERNNMKMNKDLRKLSDANKKGELESLL